LKLMKVKLTKQLNADFYHVSVNSVIEISEKEYLRGVVASEIGNAHKEACRAQAVVSRTFIYYDVKKGKAISDSSSSSQCFNALRAHNEAYHFAHQAVDDTDGEMLYHDNQPISPCSYSSSNGGKTTSSKDRWGGYRPYLIEHDDPFDYAGTKGRKTGHGVGMSQAGAKYMAQQGLSYREILLFYYPGTQLQKEESFMAQVKASDLVKIFSQMESEKWKYAAGANKQGEVDCSGAFYYAYKQLGGYMYHGSNTMWRKYTTKKGKIGEIDLIPGMAVFKCRDWTSAQSSNGWYETDPGDVYHVGMYVGDGWVVEAQSKKTGVVKTKVSTWHLAAQLVDTVYDIDENTAAAEPFVPFLGTVKINRGWLNLRSGPDTSCSREAKAYNNEVLSVVDEKDDWYIIDLNGKNLYAAKTYIVKPEQIPSEYIFTIKVSRWCKHELEEHLNSAGYVFNVQESWDAA